MSAFLGPIHVKMYERILYQDSMSQKILDLAAKQNWDDAIADAVNAKTPAAIKRPLEDIIDESNIHGWLSAAVAHCERRFALTVSSVLKDHSERLDELLSAMKAMGKEHSLPPSTDAETAYQVIHDVLLDGMPCDFPFTNIESGPESATWQIASCPHAPYWAEASCDADIYYQLRDAWMDGALGNSGITHQRPALFHHYLKRA